MEEKTTFDDNSEIAAAWGDKMGAILQSKSRFIVSRKVLYPLYKTFEIGKIDGVFIFS